MDPDEIQEGVIGTRVLCVVRVPLSSARRHSPGNEAYHDQSSVNSDPHGEKPVFVDILLQLWIRKSLFLLNQEAERTLATVEGFDISTRHSSTAFRLVKQAG